MMRVPVFIVAFAAAVLAAASLWLVWSQQPEESAREGDYVWGQQGDTFTSAFETSRGEASRTLWGSAALAGGLALGLAYASVLAAALGRPKATRTVSYATALAMAAAVTLFAFAQDLAGQVMHETVGLFMASGSVLFFIVVAITANAWLNTVRRETRAAKDAAQARQAVGRPESAQPRQGAAAAGTGQGWGA